MAVETLCSSNGGEKTREGEEKEEEKEKKGKLVEYQK